MIRFLSGAAVAAAVLAAVPAFAHATLEVGQARIGSTYKAVLRIPHGCGIEATNVVRVQIPEGFYNVKPMPKAGWTLETVIGPYEKGYDNHGTTLTEGVQEIVWKDGNLPNEWYDEFVFRGTFAERWSLARSTSRPFRNAPMARKPGSMSAATRTRRCPPRALSSFRPRPSPTETKGARLARAPLSA